MLLADADGNIDHEGLQQLRRRVVKAARSNLGKRQTRCHGSNSVRTTLVDAPVPSCPWATTRCTPARVRRPLEINQPWQQLTQMLTFPSLMVGSMAISGDGKIYVGTGSRFDGVGQGEGGSEFRGEGIWMSADEGATWTMVEGTSNFLTTDALVVTPTKTTVCGLDQAAATVPS